MPAVPDTSLTKVYGGRIPDPRVEFAVLSFEYWNQSGLVSRFLLHDETLAVVRTRINKANIDDFVQLLIERGDIDDFVTLLQYPIDQDGAFRSFMLQNGADLAQIRFYASCYGIDPKLFLDGFVIGLAESFATIVVDLWKLVELAGRAQRELFGSAVMTLMDPKAGIANFSQQIAMVGQFIDALMSQLSPAGWPEAILQKWRDWNKEFAQHLEDLDPWGAGHQFGMIAGNLWQLLTGIVALFKLLRLGARLLMRYAPLLFIELRKVGARVIAAAAQMAEILTKIGRQVVDGLTRIGYQTLRTLFPPEVLKQLREGVALIQFKNWTLMPVFEPVYANAFGGARMRPGYAVMMIDDGKPAMMAVTSDVVPTPRMVKGMQQSVGETLKSLDDVFDPAIKEAQLTAAEAEALGKAMGTVEQSLKTSLRKLVNKIAWEAFTDLRKTKGRFTAAELGNEVHRRMAAVLPGEIQKLAPQAKTALELEFRTVVGKLPGGVSERMAKALAEPVVDAVARHSELVELLEISGKAGGKPTAAEVAAWCEKNFGWGKGTTIGSLKSDLLIYDDQVTRMINVDWTSSTKLDAYEKLADRVAKDLGKTFSGDWDEIAQAYAKAGKQLPPEASNIAALTNHATRETVARLTVMQDVLTGWAITSQEMTYDGIAKLYKALKGAVP